MADPNGAYLRSFEEGKRGSRRCTKVSRGEVFLCRDLQSIPQWRMGACARPSNDFCHCGGRIVGRFQAAAVLLPFQGKDAFYRIPRVAQSRATRG
jgi:hypothetical protein